MFCTNCGTTLPPDAKFCYKCGKPTIDENPTPNAPQKDSAPIPAASTTQAASNDPNTSAGYGTANNTSGNGYVPSSSPSSNQGQYIPNGPGPQNYAYTNTPYNAAPKTPKKKNPVLPIILISIGLLLFILCVVPKHSTTTVESNDTQTTATPDPTETAEPTPEPTSNRDNDSEVESAVETDYSDVEATHVFFINLASAPSAYDGEVIETTFPVESINYDGTICSDYSYDYRIEVETGDESYADQEDSIQYVTVKGKMTIDYDDVTFENPVILYAGANEPEDYTAELAEYTEVVKQAKIAERDEFIASATVETYDDLRRNPDSFEDAPLALNVYITEVEADGWLTNGTIYATYNGNEIVIYDYRELREPRLMAGDSLTVYVEGDGLTKITTYVKGTGLFGSDLGADVVDEYEVPAFNLKYTDQDDPEKFGLDNSSDDYDYYAEKGEQLANQLNDAIDNW